MVMLYLGLELSKIFFQKLHLIEIPAKNKNQNICSYKRNISIMSLFITTNQQRKMS